MSRPTLAQIKKAYRRMNYRMFDGNDPTGSQRDLDLNIFGVRSVNAEANAFDDWIGVFWAQLGKSTWQHRIWPATTDPGRFYLLNPLNVAGTAILSEGQYRGSHSIGLHRSQYMALVQTSAVTVYRDRNLDDAIDIVPDQTQTGLFGINIHRANAYTASTQVDRWSAGCQVFSDPAHFAEFMDCLLYTSPSPRD